VASILSRREAYRVWRKRIGAITGSAAATDSTEQAQRGQAVISGPAIATGAIHIEFPGRAMITVEHGADRAVLQAILESLRK
jgi:hypothetical protein